MQYVYLIYDDWHGLLRICATPEKATEQVKDEAFSGGLPAERWGWEGVACWVREEVIQ